MCGICGAVWSDPRASLAPSSLTAMMDQIVHRGPDDSGQYRDDHAALGFRRLSIIDLAGGHQPLSNENGTIWTVFNGEIYNFPRLTPAARSQGARSTLQWRHRGPRSPLRRRGNADVLAVAGDVRTGDLGRAATDTVLARDRLGQKPLVYRHDGRPSCLPAS